MGTDGELKEKHRCFIVVQLQERDQYNTTEENFKGNNASRLMCNISLGTTGGNTLIICREKSVHLLKSFL